MGTRDAQPKRSQTSGTDSDNSYYELLDGTLGYTIKRAQVHAYELFFKCLGPDVISPARITALMLIGSHPGISQSSLAKKLNISRAGTVKVIDMLESLSLVERSAKTGDRRSYSLNLTPTGQEELSSLSEQIAEFDRTLSSNLTADERDQLMSLLHKVINTGAKAGKKK